MPRTPKVVRTPLERKAEFTKAAMLREKGVELAAKEDLDVSWTHLKACFEGDRTPSDDLAQRAAEYVGIPADEFWGPREMAKAG
jgi:hypothetical protein